MTKKLKHFSFHTIVLSLFLLTSCKKNILEVPYEIISTPVNTRINKSFWLNKDVGFFCGGEKSSSGYIYKTINGGITWTNQFQNNTSLYDILFINDSVGYCCGEDMVIEKTTDGGNTWFFHTKPSNTVIYYRGTIYGIEALANKVYFFAGKNFNIGSIITEENGILREDFKRFNGELRCGFASDNSTYIACGYGICFKTIDDGNSFHSLDFGNTFLTSVSKINNDIAMFSDYNGKIYKYNSATNNAKQIFKTKRKLKNGINFNGLFFSSESAGWAVGDNGTIYRTQNGDLFNKVDLKTNANFHSIVSNKNNELIISTSEGKLIKIAN